MINIDRLDSGYETTQKMYFLEKEEGVQILNDLEALIVNLKEHWVGTDSTHRINQLIGVHNQLQNYLKGCFATTSLAMQQLVQLQEVRKANGNGGQVGDVQKMDDSFVKSIPRLLPTEKFYVDPAVRTDYKNLLDIGDRVKKFAEEIEADRVELIDNNWHEGNHRDEVNQVFEEVNSLEKEFETVFSGVAGQLDKAIGNLEKVME